LSDYSIGCTAVCDTLIGKTRISTETEAKTCI